MKQNYYQIPENKRLRVIIDTDCNCEADDQFALLHAIMTPKLDVVGIIGTHYGTRFGTTTTEKTAALSYDEVVRVLNIAGLSEEIPVFHGGGVALPNEDTPADSDGVQFIIAEARKSDPRPLVVLNQGAISNLASAYLLAPDIGDKLTAVWTGGAGYPAGGWEFNLCNDINAANVIMKSNIELWQMPSHTVSMMKVGIMSLYENVYPCGKIGRYLMDKLAEVNLMMCSMDSSCFFEGEPSGTALRSAYPNGESWILGDNTVIGALLHDHAGDYAMQIAPRIAPETGFYQPGDDPNRKIRVYHYIDARFVLDDFYAKLRYYFGKENDMDTKKPEKRPI